MYTAFIQTPIEWLKRATLLRIRNLTMQMLRLFRPAVGAVAAVAMIQLAFAAQGPEKPDGAAIIERYLQTMQPLHPPDPMTREEVDWLMKKRDAAVAEMKAAPNETLAAAERILRESRDSKRRYEVVGLLTIVQTRPCADLLHQVLEDVREPEDKDSALYERLTRQSAVHGLRGMARRIDRAGPGRLRVGPEIEPKVPGLTPYLIAAAQDKAQEVRVAALYALSDNGEPAAVTALRAALKDPAESVRFHAACFLTEHQDVSGLPEMKKALAALRSAKPEPNLPETFSDSGKVAMLLGAFERATGKSFGPIPMNPIYLSDGAHAAASARELRRMIEAWAQWWDWQPGPEGTGGTHGKDAP